MEMTINSKRQQTNIKQSFKKKEEILKETYIGAMAKFNLERHLKPVALTFKQYCNQKKTIIIN